METAAIVFGSINTALLAVILWILSSMNDRLTFLEQQQMYRRGDEQNYRRGDD